MQDVHVDVGNVGPKTATNAPPGSFGEAYPAAIPFVSLPPGDGPRHITFHPNGRWLYSLQEESLMLTYFSYNSSSGELISQQTISALPPGFAGTSFASELQCSDDGRLLYAANRLHDSIRCFRSISKES